MSSLHRDTDSVSRRSLVNDDAHHGDEGVDMMQADNGAMPNRSAYSYTPSVYNLMFLSQCHDTS